MRRAVNRAVKPVAADVQKSLKPVEKTIKDSLEEPFQDAARTVGRAMEDVERNVQGSLRNVNSESERTERAIGELQAKIGDLRRQAAERISLDINADTADINAQINQLQRNLRTLEQRRVDIEANASTAGAQANIDRFLASNSGRGIDIKVDVERGAFDRLSGVFDKIGTSAAGAVSGGMGPLIAAIVAAALAAVPLISAMVTASGSLLTVGTVASSLALAFAAVKVGSMGVGDALKAQSKAQQELAETGEVSAETQKALDAAMKNLAPSARGLVKTISAIGPAWSKVRKQTQQALFQDTGPLLQRLSDKLLPSVRRALVGVAADFNDMAHAAVGAVTSSGTVKKIGDTLQGLRGILRDLLPALGNIAAGLGNLFAGSIGEAGTLAERFRSISETFRAWTQDITASGQFQQFLSDATEAAGSLFRALGAIGGAVGAVVKATSDIGVGAFDGIARSFAALDEQLSSAAGQTAIQGFFTGLYEVLGIVTDTIGNLGPVFAGLGDIFSALEGPFSRLRTAFDGFTEALGVSLGNTLSDLAGPLATVVDGFARFVQALTPLAPIIAPVALALGAIALAFGPIAGAIGLVVGPLAKFVGFLRFLAPLLGVAVGPLAAIVLAIAALGAAFVIAYKKSATFRDTVDKAFSAIKDAVTTAWNAIRPALEDLWQVIQDDVIPAVADLWEAFKPVVDFILGKVVPVLVKLYGQYLKLVIKAITLLVKGLAFLVKNFAVAVKGVIDFGKWIVKIGQDIAKFVGDVIGFFADLPGSIGSALSSLASTVGGIFSSVFGAIRAAVEPVITFIVGAFKLWYIGMFQIVKFLLSVLAPAITAIGGVISGLAGAIGNAVATFGRLLAAVRRVFTGVANAIKAGVQKAAEFIGNWVKRVIQFYVNLGQRVGTLVANLVGRVVGLFTNLVARVVGVIAPFVSRVVGFFRSLIERARSVVSSGLQRIVDLFRTILGRAQTVAKNILDKIRSAFETFRDKIQGVIEGIGNFIGNLKGYLEDLLGIVGKIKDALSSIPDIDLPDLGDLNPFGRGGIVTGPTAALVGEAGREVIIPLTRPERAAQLVAASGLLNLKSVRNLIKASLVNSALRTGGVPGVSAGVLASTPALSRPFSASPVVTVAAAPTVVQAGGPSKATTVNNTFNLIPGGDPEAHAQQIMSRIAAGLER